MDYVNGIPALDLDDAVSDVPLYTDELRDALIGEDGLIHDTGWVAIETLPAYSPHNSFPPQVRRIGVQVYIRGGWGSSGLSSGDTQIVAIVPVGFRPSAVTGASASAFSTFWAPATSAIGRVRVYGNGNVELGVAGGSVPSSLLVSDGTCWFTD